MAKQVELPKEGVRFLTWEFADGTSITQQHFELMDGEWKFPDHVYEVVFKSRATWEKV